jgi:hypothetical protein
LFQRLHTPSDLASDGVGEAWKIDRDWLSPYGSQPDAAGPRPHRGRCRLSRQSWPKLFGDTPAVTAFPDRLMHYGHLLEICGKSYRLHESSLSRANRKEVTPP